MSDHTPTHYFPDNLEDYAPWVARRGLFAPYGKCQCGCGENAPRATRTSKEDGYIKDHPCRFIRGHGAVPNSYVASVPPVPVEGTRSILLSKGMYAIVDAADYEWLTQWHWRAERGKGNRTFYAARRERLPSGKSSRVTMHQLLCGKGCDHIDGDGLNNRRVNLRLATNSQNLANRRIFTVNTSGYKGVAWNKNCGKWQAQIGIEGKTHYLGLHVRVEDAAIAYDEAARKLFGEFARLNFPNGQERQA